MLLDGNTRIFLIMLPFSPVFNSSEMYVFSQFHEEIGHQLWPKLKKSRCEPLYVLSGFIWKVSNIFFNLFNQMILYLFDDTYVCRCYISIRNYIDSINNDTRLIFFSFFLFSFFVVVVNIIAITNTFMNDWPYDLKKMKKQLCLLKKSMEIQGEIQMKVWGTAWRSGNWILQFTALRTRAVNVLESINGMETDCVSESNGTVLDVT